MKPYRETALGLQNPPKLSPKWYGPFKVLKKVGQVSYQIQLPEKCKLHDIFHVSHLKNHIGPRVVPNSTLPMVTDDGKVKTVPIDVLHHRIVPRFAGDYDVAIPQWSVHWDAMTTEEATWEDAEFIQRMFPDFQT
jgi:hypothetical protein